MGGLTEFEILEQQFLEVIAEFKTLTISENRLRESLRTELTRAEAAEAGRAAAQLEAAESRNGAAAATAAVTKATAALTTAQEQVTELKIHLELTERQRKSLEDRCTDMSNQINSMERQLQKLRPLQSAQVTLQKQYTELQERICSAVEEARRESSRLETEFRRVEKCAAAGSEIRERARLAAAAHARERRLATTELQHANRELLNSNAEITKLKAIIAELQIRLSKASSMDATKKTKDPNNDALVELRAALEAERTGAAKLEEALTAALADNVTLASRLHAMDNNDERDKLLTSQEIYQTTSNICPIDSFLAE